MDLSTLNIRTTIQIDFAICPRLVQLYADSTHDMFVGEKDGPYDLVKAEERLKKYVSAKMDGSHNRDGFMKIFYGSVLVGWAVPRVVDPKEHKALKLDDNLTYHRLGTVYIDPKFRGKGIVADAIKEFRKLNPNVVWTCNELNTASKKAALNGGLKFSHKLYVKDTENWAFEPFEEMVWVAEIYST